jgi:hypothetical protein
MFEFEATVNQSVEEQEELFKALTEKALSDAHTAWEFINNPIECGVIKKTKKGLFKIIELYENICASLYLEYCKQVKTNEQDFGVLVALKQYQHCKTFYEEELLTVTDMLAEYAAYVCSGHFIDQFICGLNRESWHRWDHREGGPSGD